MESRHTATSLTLRLVGTDSDHYHAPERNCTISFIMAILTYLTAPWTVRALLRGLRHEMSALAVRRPTTLVQPSIESPAVSGVPP